MIASWMAYSLLTALLLGGAGLAAEHSLRLHHRPTRWVWLGAILVSLAVPAYHFLVPQSEADSAGALWAGLDSLIEAAQVTGAIAAVSAESPHIFARIETLLVGFWVAASLGLLLYYFRSFQRLSRESRRWSLRTVDGVRILVAEDTGPAVMGFHRAQIVVPEWALDLEGDYRRIVILHEEEHLRAGDHRLLLVGLAALVCLPWNPVVWWQVRRLRSAVEFDCDRRVLRRGAHPHTYSVLLLEISRRASCKRLPRAAFAESRSLLERRIRRMVAAVPRYRGRKSLVAGMAAALLLAFACQTQPPTEPATDGPATASLADPMSAPSETPFTVRPKVRDPLAAVRAVQRNYPEALREARIGALVDVWVFVDADGKVKKARLVESSDIAPLDRAAVLAAQEFEFEPARREGRIVPAWITVRIAMTPN